MSFLEADENEIAADVLETATDAFREDRNLISAEEMTRWLEQRGMEAEEWIGFVERGLARKRCAGQIEEILRGFPVDEAAVAAALDCEAICSGLAGTVARKLGAVAAFVAEEGALETATSPEDEERRRERVTKLAAAFDRLQSQAISDEGIARMIGNHRLDWTALECRLASFASEDAAREASFCVLEEGADLAQVALDAGTRMEEPTFLLQDVEPDVQTKLLSAEQGRLVGPLPLRGRPTLLAVLSKKPPQAADPGVRQLAERALVAASVERHSRAAQFLIEL